MAIDDARQERQREAVFTMARWTTLRFEQE
jgi:hypothetical protein